MRGAAPRGYTRLELGGVEAVVSEDLAPAVRDALGSGTLYDWARARPDSRLLSGRRPAVALTLRDGGPRVVVRRSHHGGLLAPILRDLFVPPTRAPYELLASMVLHRLDVPTPAVLAFALYPAGPLLKRSDVITQELEGRDAAALSGEGVDVRQSLLEPVARLLRRLSAAGIWHPDLNLRNVLLVPEAESLKAYLLDIDRVRFEAPGDTRVAVANLQRLERSARKMRRLGDAGFDDAELRTLRALASEARQA